MGGLHISFMLAVIATGVAADYDVNYGRHNITMGHRRLPPYYPYDMLLYHDSPKVSGSWFPYPKRVISKDVCYPPKWSRPSRSTITAFNVTDLIPGGNGGYAYVTRGGVGSSFLCLHLKTQRGKGFHFNVNVYGCYNYDD